MKGAKTATAPLPAERAPLDPELQAALNAPPLPQYDLSLSLETKPKDEPAKAPRGAGRRDRARPAA